MSEARGKFEWRQTASLMAMIANIMRDPKKGKPAHPDDFNPYTQKPIAIAPLSILKDVFVKGKK